MAGPKATPNAIALKSFVEALDLPPAPRRSRSAQIAPETNFTASENQAMIVGANIVSFSSGLKQDLRELVVNCSLLAQLAANRKVPSRSDIDSWYSAYFDTLTNLGWAVQERGFSEHREVGDNFEAHNAIVSIATAVLGPSAPALLVIESTLNAMKSMSDGPWVTIFNRESQSANAARFQITVAEPAADDAAMISLFAFELEAKSALIQVLFFKFRSTDITFRHASGSVTINMPALKDVSDTIAQKVGAYLRSYVRSLEI